MRPVIDTLPTYQVVAVLAEHMRARKLSASDIDKAAGYKKAGVTRRILRQQNATVDVPVAERLLEAVGGALWEIPDYNLSSMKPRRIRLRMVTCACGCGTRTLSHYVSVRKTGTHQWRKKVGLDTRHSTVRGGRQDRVYLHGHKSRTPELRGRYADTTRAAWSASPQRRLEQSQRQSAAWTPERRAAHAEKIRAAHSQGRYSEKRQ